MYNTHPPCWNFCYQPSMTTVFLQETDWGYKVISLLWYVKGCPPPCTHLPPHSLAGNLVRVVFCQYCKEFLRKFCVLAREFHVTKKLTSGATCLVDASFPGKLICKSVMQVFFSAPAILFSQHVGARGLFRSQFAKRLFLKAYILSVQVLFRNKATIFFGNHM